MTRTRRMAMERYRLTVVMYNDGYGKLKGFMK